MLGEGTIGGGWRMEVVAMAVAIEEGMQEGEAW